MKINNPERFTRLPDAFLFDTDNTLYPYDPAHEAAQLAVREKVSKTFTADWSDAACSADRSMESAPADEVRGRGACRNGWRSEK